MYEVKINVSSDIIDRGELITIILNAVKSHIIGIAKINDDEPLIDVRQV